MSRFNSNSGMTQFIPSHIGQEVAVDGTVRTFTIPADINFNGGLVGVKTNSILVTFDGTDPASAGAGFLYAVGTYYWSREMCEKARMIEAAGSSAGVARLELGS